MFTTSSSLNKWTPYTLSGATFNDTTKTITVSGTTALSGLTDVIISSPTDTQILQYSSSSSKWSNVTSVSISLVSGLQTQLNSMTSSTTTNSNAITALQSSNFSLSLGALTQNQTYTFYYDDTHNETVSSILTSTEMGSVTYVTPNADDHENVNNGGSLISGSHFYSQNTLIQFSPNSTAVNLGTYPFIFNEYFTTLTAINTFSISSNITVFGSSSRCPTSFQIWGNNYGSSDSGRFNYSTGTLLWSETAYFTNASNGSLYTGETYYANSGNAYGLRDLIGFNPSNTAFLSYSLVIFKVNNQSTLNAAGAGYMASYFIPKQAQLITAPRYTPADFTITTATNGNPILTKQSSTNTVSSYTNMNNICIYELFRRVFPVIRDKNTIKLTDGTHNITMSSTSSGYSIGQCTDTTISTPTSGQLLAYNGTNWANSSNCTLTQLNFSNSGNTISLVAPTLSSSSNYFLPTTSASSVGQVLTCSGVLGTSNTLTWAPCNQLQFNYIKILNLNDFIGINITIDGSSIHISCGQHPPPDFLAHYHRQACSRCCILIPEGRPCPSCAGRESRVLQRWARKPGPTDSANSAVAPLQQQQSQEDPIVPFSLQPGPDEFDSALPDVETVLKAPVTTLLHIPKHLRPQWNSLMTKLLVDFLTTKSRRSFQLLLMAPKCLLGPLPRSGTKHAKQAASILSGRFSRWEQGDLQALWQESTKKRSGKNQHQQNERKMEDLSEFVDPKLNRAITRAVSEGAYSKGISLLSGESRLAEVNEDTVAKLHLLHPSGCSIPVSSSYVDPFAVDNLKIKHVLKALRSFKPLSAPGPSGLRPSHLLEALDVPTLGPKNSFKEALRQWILLCARGELPTWSGPWIAAARLIPLLKASGGIRPVAVGEVLRRLTSKVLQRSFSTRLTGALAPLQLGVGVRGATEQIARKLRRILIANPGAFVLQIDLSNAFNSVDRSKVQEGLRSQLPELLPWFELTHSQPSPLFCQDQVLVSQQGTQQGDPLGPAFFALAIHPVISAIDTGLLWEAWYHDDGILVGDESAVLAALASVGEHLLRMGLRVNLSKCTLWSPQGMLRSEGPVAVSDWSTPHVVLGTPFGSAAAEQQFLESVHRKHERLLQRLSQLPDTQIAVSLLRYCLGAQKVNHLLRVMWSERASTFVTATAVGIRRALEGILGRSLPDAAWLQSCLPIRHGGLGIQNPALTHSAAFLASALAEYSGAFSTTWEETSPCAEFWDVVDSLSNQLVEDTTLAQWQVEHILPPREHILEAKFHEQRVWSDKVHLRLKQELTTSLPLRDQVRLRDQSEEHAGGWLSVVPNDNLGSRFAKGEYQLLVEFHLGLPLLPDSAAGHPCDKCGQPMDVFGDHFLTCRHSGLWRRHNFPRDVLSDIATSAGLRCQTEACVQGKARPADVLVYEWDSGRDLAVDLTVRHPLAASGQWDPRKSQLADAEEEKNRKYLAVCNDEGMDFTPAGISTFGAFGSQGRSFLSKLFNRYAKRFGREQEERFLGQFQLQCWERLSVALHKAIALQLTSVFTQLGGIVGKPYDAPVPEHLP